MTIKQAKLLREGSAFWSPSRNGHDVSGYRLQVVVAHTEDGLIAVDEHGYRTGWLFSKRFVGWAGCTLVKPAGASEVDGLLDHLRNIGLLHK